MKVLTGKLKSVNPGKYIDEAGLLNDWPRTTFREIGRDRGVSPVLNPVSNPDSQKLSKPPHKSVSVRFVMFQYVYETIESCRFP